MGNFLIAILTAHAAGPSAFDTMDFQTFDQSTSGWRSLNEPLRQAEVIDTYSRCHLSSLDPSQRALLAWHAGQAFAMAGDYGHAKARFRLAFLVMEQNEDSLGWNAYVRGTLAFLEKDRPALLAAIRELKRAREASATNLKILKSLALNMEATYAEAYRTD